MFNKKKVLADNKSSVALLYLSTKDKVTILFDELHRPLDNLYVFSKEKVHLVGSLFASEDGWSQDSKSLPHSRCQQHHPRENLDGQT